LTGIPEIPNPAVVVRLPDTRILVELTETTARFDSIVGRVPFGEAPMLLQNIASARRNTPMISIRRVVDILYLFAQSVIGKILHVDYWHQFDQFRHLQSVMNHLAESPMKSQLHQVPHGLQIDISRPFEADFTVALHGYHSYKRKTWIELHKKGLKTAFDRYWRSHKGGHAWHGLESQNGARSRNLDI
jgi:hypothetical protein